MSSLHSPSRGFFYTLPNGWCTWIGASVARVCQAERGLGLSARSYIGAFIGVWIMGRVLPVGSPCFSSWGTRSPSGSLLGSFCGIQSLLGLGTLSGLGCAKHQKPQTSLHRLTSRPSIVCTSVKLRPLAKGETNNGKTAGAVLGWPRSRRLGLDRRGLPKGITIQSPRGGTGFGDGPKYFFHYDPADAYFFPAAWSLNYLFISLLLWNYFSYILKVIIFSTLGSYNIFILPSSCLKLFISKISLLPGD